MIFVHLYMGTFSNMVLHNSTVMENGIPYSAKCPYCYTDVQHHGCLILTYLLTYLLVAVFDQSFRHCYVHRQRLAAQFNAANNWRQM